MPEYDFEVTLEHKLISDGTLSKEQLHALIADEPAFLQQHGIKTLKLDNSRRKMVSLIEVDGKMYALKEYQCFSLWRSVKQAFKISGAFLSWNNAHTLLDIGIPTPKPVAAIEKREGVLQRRGYFITEYLDGTSGKEYFATKVEQEGCDQLLAIFDRLREHYLIHGDLKPDNFLFSHHTLYLLDLDRMHQYSMSSKQFFWMHQKDLARFVDDWDVDTVPLDLSCHDGKSATDINRILHAK